MHVAELWRYPVKSMAGEKLAVARLGPDGVEGDRLVLARGSDGRVVTSRTRPRLLGHRAVLGPDGEPLVDGRPWRAPEVARDVEAAAGAGVRLEPADEERFDVLQGGAVRVGDPVELAGWAREVPRTAYRAAANASSKSSLMSSMCSMPTDTRI